MNGPYDSPSQVHNTARRASRDGPYVPLRHAALSLLTAAVDSTGARLGSYDRDVIIWLAAAEPEIAIVIAGLVARAHAAGQGNTR